jgi:hypothetical protein
MTRFTATLIEVVLVPVTLLVFIGTALLGLNGINNRDIRYLAGCALGVGILLGMTRLFKVIEQNKH